MTTTTKNQDAYQLLRDLILQEKVLPNERLVEADLAERFGTNRLHVRSAIAALEQEGLVAIEPFKGAKVRLIKGEEAIEIFEVRGALEVVVARQAAVRATDEDRLQIITLLDNVRQLVPLKNGMAVGRASRILREEIWRISGHTTASNLLRKLNSQLVRFWYQLSNSPGRAAVVLSDLEAIASAVCSGSAAKAGKAAQTYHNHAIEALRKTVKAQQNTDI